MREADLLAETALYARSYRMSTILLTLINSSKNSLQDKIAEMANLSRCGRKGTAPEEPCHSAKG